MKRAIPRVAAAALTLGGTAAGCGDDGGSNTVEGAARDFCRKVADCYGGGNVDACVDSTYEDYVPSYVTEECRTSLVNFLNCFTASWECGAGPDFYACGEEADALYYDCDTYAYY